MSEKCIRIFTDDECLKPYIDLLYEVLTPRPFRIVNVKAVTDFQIFIAEFEGKYFIYTSDGFALPPCDPVGELAFLLHNLLNLGMHPLMRRIVKAVLINLIYDDAIVALSEEVSDNA